MKKILFIAAAVAIGFTVTRCGGSSSGGGGAATTVPALVGTITQSYQAAGSFWSANFTATNFRIDKYTNYGDTTAILSVYGTYSTDPTTLIMSLVVTSASGTDAPAPGATAYGLEIPGTVFFLKPSNAGSEIIPMVKSGTCPIATKNYNWIIAKFNSSPITPSTAEGYGQASFLNNGSGTVTASNITDKKNMDGSAGGSNNTGPTGACVNGYLSGSGVDMYLTQSGGAIVKTNNGGSEFIFASPKHSVDVIASDLNGTYTVLVFNDDSSGDKNFPAKLIMSGGTGTGDKITNISTDATEGSPVTFSAFSALASSNGIFSLTFDTTGRLNCNYYVDSGKKVIACNGYASGNKPFFLLGRQR